MNIQATHPATPDELLRWNEGRDGKREFVRGGVVEGTIHVTRSHVRLATRLVVALSRRLDAAIYDIGSADFAVRTPDGIRYPDVLVDRITPESRSSDLAATQPILLAEIQSPSAYGRDFSEKLADYQGMNAVQYYLIPSQEEPRVWLCERTEESWSEVREIAGGEAVIQLSTLQVEIPLSELYTGIGRWPVS